MTCCWLYCTEANSLSLTRHTTIDKWLTGQTTDRQTDITQINKLPKPQTN